MINFTLQNFQNLQSEKNCILKEKTFEVQKLDAFSHSEWRKERFQFFSIGAQN